AGIPFLVMEYIDGVPITRYVNDHKLGVRQRLELLLTVLRAVDAAHRSLVVHRDLKPSNIMVDAEGRVKLIDFGIAKLLEDDLDQATVGVYTPDYAAPEQVTGQPITTATDVYSLGVVMHELLLGVRPRGQPPRRPSVLAAELALAGKNEVKAALPMRSMKLILRGDLDNIVLKALSTDADQRYPSAGAFADDIQRYLDRQPVNAHPPSSWYRTRKFVARHKGGVLSSVAFVLAIVATMTVALWQANVAQREAIRADAQAQRAISVRDFLVSVFESAQADVPRDKRPAVEDLVQEAADSALANTTLPPAIRLDLLLTLAQVTQSMGDADRAHALLDRVDAGLALRPNVVSKEDDVQSLRAHFIRGSAWMNRGKPVEAQSALESVRQQLVSRSDGLGVDALILLGDAQTTDSRIDDARLTWADARTVAALLDNDAVAAGLRVDAAEAEGLTYSGRYADGLAMADATLARKRAIDATPDRTELLLLSTISKAASITGALDRADEAYREWISTAEHLHARPHQETAWAIGLYGSHLVAKARFADAEPFILRALNMRRSLLGDSHPDTLNGLAALGRLRAGQGRNAEAIAAFEEGVASCRKAQVRQPVCPKLLGSLAQMLLGEGQFDRAGEFAGRAVDDQIAMSGKDSPLLINPLQYRARTEVSRGRFEDALRTTDTLLALATRAGTLASMEVRYARLQRALALFALDRNAESLELIKAVVTEHKSATPDEKKTLFLMLELQARALSKADRHEEAKTVAAEALAIAPESKEPNDKSLVGLKRLVSTGRDY
ncbi:MAG: serine/threonine-protein kinase, partial [Dokdonella sp.]